LSGCITLAAGRQIDNSDHMAEGQAMHTVSFATLIICKGSLQTG
jgi:hypothetical protein